MSLFLLVGGLFHGQTRDMALPPGRDEVVLAVHEPLAARTLASYVDEPLAEVTLRTVRYRRGSPRMAEDYFADWRHVEGRRLDGLLLAPDVQRCGMQVSVTAEPELRDLAPDAYEQATERWRREREYAEHHALRAVADSHAVNRPVSAVVRSEQPSPIAYMQQSVLRYEWLAEVRTRVGGVTVEHLGQVERLSDRIRVLAEATFPDGVPAELRELINRANAREGDR